MDERAAEELDYEAIPYESVAVPCTAPAALVMTARAHGGPRPSLEGARVLELGCGDGANLLPLAAHHPDWALLGIDASAGAIARARAAAEALGLRNLRFERGDLADLEADGALEPGAWDFAIAHGVYSWIDAGRRTALRRALRRALAPDGLAYASFNAQPGWGVRGRIRDALTRFPAGGLDAARRRAAALADGLGEPAGDWSSMLHRELSRAAEAPDAYLAHEYLAPHNDAFWLGDVVRDFAEAGLAYVGDASFDRPDGFVSPALRARAAPLAEDPVAREELLDLWLYRQLRTAVFARDDAPTPPADGPEALDALFAAGVFRATNDPFDPRDGVEERLVGANEVEARPRSALIKAALLVLSHDYPRGYRLADLVEEARARLAAWGVVPDDGPDAVARLREGLWALRAEGALELRASDPALRTEPGPRPAALPITRHEAAARAALSTPLHTLLPVEPLDRAIIARLDGTRAPEEVTADVVEAARTGALTLEGAPSGVERLRAAVSARLEGTLRTLAWWGLVR